MSDLTAAVEALRKVFGSQEGSYLYTKGYLDESDFELMLATAGPIIEAAARADERAKTAEAIADALHARSETPTAEGDQDRWQTYRDAAAIAREHAVRMPQDAATGTAGVSASGDSTDGSKGAQGLSGGPYGSGR